ncbi:hypothetical protein HOS86_gp087 [Klebsiella phage vB_KpnM_KpS110]|uniref:Uncharacterized protein n=2 Tax=Taipeivirus TaxID=2731621 RepID=A0A5Q2F1B1_9CAUD|nr:hypothetical protein HOS86_gp087 [Klebsiella phage vB_KpnM_KpS110]YP_009884702.1 hypothetical protein HYQ02_gp108 [Klebsiella phage UPM 2146]AUV59203.1 hypothetical protein kps110_087 [Klebsiella phage vB_KpnM_KpS110]QGF20626.1 hypothetical protein [Klebsiella phage UPM 2146]WJJ58786.1 hypothetical protein MDA2066_orf105 [Klebsiella phage vB_KpnS_MDA2066]
MSVKLTESMSLHQQQAILDEIVISAVKQGIIRDDTLLTRPEMIHHLAVCLGEASYPRKKIVLFKEGIIHPSGRCAFLTLVEAHPVAEKNEIKTSIPVTPYTKDVNELTWFETINTIYIMAVGGQPIQDLRGDLNYTQAE